MRTAAVLLNLILLVACPSDPSGERTPTPRQVTGAITELSRDGEGLIEAFTVEASNGRYRIQIDSRRDYGFDLEHLAEHRATGDPVRVTLVQRDGHLVATAILDA